MYRHYDFVLFYCRNKTGVIYCLSRKECEDVSSDLRDCGVSAVAYHAGLSDKERGRIQSMWMNDKAKVSERHTDKNGF